MTDPSAPKPPAIAPQQIMQLAGQAPGMFANHIMAATDGNVVFLTFSQATPVVQSAAQFSGEMQKFQNVPMIASPVAKVVIVPKMVSQLIQSLQDLTSQLEKQKSP